MTAYSGDSGSTGASRAGFWIDTDDLTQFRNPADPYDGWRVALQEGQSAELPDGAGSITFSGHAEWGAFQVAHDPAGKGLALASAIGIVGVSASPGRRRAAAGMGAPDAGWTAYGGRGRGLARGEGRGFPAKFAQLTREMGGVEGAQQVRGQRGPRRAEQELLTRRDRRLRRCHGALRRPTRVRRAGRRRELQPLCRWGQGRRRSATACRSPRWDAARLGRSAVALTMLALSASARRAGGARPGEPCWWGNMYEFSGRGADGHRGVPGTADSPGRAPRRALGWRWSRLTLGLAVTVLDTTLRRWCWPWRSNWLIIHVSVMVLSFAIFTVGAVLAALYLWRLRDEQRGSLGAVTRRLLMRPRWIGDVPGPRLRLPAVHVRGHRRRDLRAPAVLGVIPGRRGRSSPGRSTRRTCTRARPGRLARSLCRW